MANYTKNRGVGVKGRSGRKGAGYEWQQAQAAHEDFNEEIDVAKLAEKVKSGKRSIRDMTKLKGVSGETPVVLKFMEKVYPTPTSQDINITSRFEDTAEIGKTMVELANALKTAKKPTTHDK